MTDVFDPFPFLHYDVKNRLHLWMTVRIAVKKKAGRLEHHTGHVDKVPAEVVDHLTETGKSLGTRNHPEFHLKNDNFRLKKTRTNSPIYMTLISFVSILSSLLERWMKMLIVVLSME